MGSNYKKKKKFASTAETLVNEAVKATNNLGSFGLGFDVSYLKEKIAKQKEKADKGILINNITKNQAFFMLEESTTRKIYMKYDNEEFIQVFSKEAIKEIIKNATHKHSIRYKFEEDELAVD